MTTTFDEAEFLQFNITDHDMEGGEGELGTHDEVLPPCASDLLDKLIHWDGLETRVKPEVNLFVAFLFLEPQFKLLFGKHEDAALMQVLMEDPYYLNFLLTLDSENEIKKLVQKFKFLDIAIEAFRHTLGIDTMDQMMKLKTFIIRSYGGNFLMQIGKYGYQTKRDKKRDRKKYDQLAPDYRRMISTFEWGIKNTPLFNELLPYFQ